MSDPTGFAAVQQMLARSRLSIDACESGRTSFFTHLGAMGKLVPGPWIAHRDLLYALALANLSPAHRTSLARAVLVEHGREFGVGRLLLEAVPSGLPFGGSSVRIAPRGGGDHCLHTWALAPEAKPALCHWLLLRAQPEWALDAPPRELTARGLRTLAELGGETLILVASPVAARQVADSLGDEAPITGHPRFLPHLREHEPQAPLVLWPHDALDAPGLSRREPRTLVLVGAPERVRQQCERWAAARRKVEIVEATCPGRANRSRIGAFWEACGEPNVVLRGDPGWASQGTDWLRQLGASVTAHAESTQLGLF